jgi:hypothetical protein
VADLIRDILTGIGALVVAVFAVGAALWARTSLQERRAARRPLPDLDELSPDALKRLQDDLEALDRGEQPWTQD